METKIKDSIGLFLKRLVCNHLFSHHRNLYGDEAMQTGKRSVWKCKHCGKYKYMAFFWEGKL